MALTTHSPTPEPTPEPTPAPTTAAPTTTTSGLVTLLFDDTMCMTLDGPDNVNILGCTGGSNQLLSYEASTQRIVMSGYGCLEWDIDGSTNTGANSIVIAPCHNGNNQRWWYDVNSRLRSEQDLSLCADYNLVDNLYMSGCVSSLVG